MQPPDWNAAAAAAAARYAEDAGRQKTFSPAPQTLRKPCVPREFDAATERMMAERLHLPSDPDPVGPNAAANCIIVGGFPKCVQKLGIPLGGRRSTRDLSRDIRSGTRAASSVPATDVCD